MAGFQSPISIDQAMQSIRQRHYLLPAFQREYVWKKQQIEELFDSLMKDYPISSMLFWSVKDESKTAWKFYEFLKYYRERWHTHNDSFNTSGHKDFFAVLDGQQRLTSLYLALFGNYDIHKPYKKWDNDDRYFGICDFYFNLTQSEKPKNENVKYEFLWLDRKMTEQKGIYVDKQEQKWFKCKEIYKHETTKVRKIAREFALDENEEERLDLFHSKIFRESLINYYLEEEQNPDKAVNIFIRINYGGTYLSYSDILFSIVIANWNEIDAREEINKLVDKINREYGFNISKDLILKGFLYLFHNSISFEINHFDENFTKDIESRWESIRDAFIETFRLLRSFGFEAKTLSSNNAVLPILYFIYRKGLTDSIVDSVGQKENRQLIKKWLLRSIIFKSFSGGDNVLANTRKAFVKHFGQDARFFDEELDYFPWKEIEKETKLLSLDREYLKDNVMWYQKNSAECFAVLSLLYPNLDYRNNNFHKDHLHPESAYKEYEEISKKRAKEKLDYEPKDFKYYNSLVNLQMLCANENMAKQDKPLEQWVNENCGNDRDDFLNKHLIPDVDLSLENFDEFAKAREELLLDRLIEVLNK